MATNRTRIQRKYDKAHCKGIYLKLNIKSDLDILTWMEEQPNVQGAIKALIRSNLELIAAATSTPPAPDENQLDWDEYAATEAASAALDALDLDAEPAEPAALDTGQPPQDAPEPTPEPKQRRKYTRKEYTYIVTYYIKRNGTETAVTDEVKAHNAEDACAIIRAAEPQDGPHRFRLSAKRV